VAISTAKSRAIDRNQRLPGVTTSSEFLDLGGRPYVIFVPMDVRIESRTVNLRRDKASDENRTNLGKRR
jgi:hypothetical protein